MSGARSLLDGKLREGREKLTKALAKEILSGDVKEEEAKANIKTLASDAANSSAADDEPAVAFKVDVHARRQKRTRPRPSCARIAELEESLEEAAAQKAAWEAAAAATGGTRED